jgi:hypothetical protein
LGFSHTENVAFATPLLEKLAPRARVVVINADGFFADQATAPAEHVLFDQDAKTEYHRKRSWQLAHQMICGAVAFACGGDIAFFRDRRDGTWRLSPSDELVPSGVGNSDKLDRNRLQRQLTLAAEFVSRLDASRDCVLLTVVPWQSTPRAEAGAIAEVLGLPFVAPELSDLHTFDGSHLDLPSAERWAREFFAAAGSPIDRCLNAAGSR